MTNQVQAMRGLVIYVACLALAVFLGFMLATPEDKTTLLVMGALFGLLALPLLMRWYHPLLIFTWNMTAVAFFLPGQLQLWMLFAVAGVVLAAAQRSLNRGMKFLSAWSVICPLLALLAVILVTAHFTGGVNFRSAGSGTYGGRRYLVLLLSIIGFFALISRRVAVERVPLYLALFLLSGVTLAISSLVTVVNLSGLMWQMIFMIFPPDVEAYRRTFDVSGDAIDRIGGLGAAASMVFYAVLGVCGIRGLLGFRNGWKLVLVVLALVGGLFGGFRSILISMLLTGALVFWLEGLWRTRLLPLALLALLAAAAVVVPFMDKMPPPVQRAFCFLPVKVSPVVARDAQDSSEWRLQMWRQLWPKVPDYLWLGKGFAINGADLELAQNLANSGQGDTAEVAMLAGDYHSGPLSVLIPLGAWGALAFLWFLIAATRVLWRNYRYGDPALQRVNTFLLAYFAMRTIMFFAVVGALNYDLYIFTGIVGLSICFNGGIAARQTAEPAPRPPFRKPAAPSPAPAIS